MNTEIKSAEEELLFKIVEQWGNAMCPLSEKVKWLKEYAAQSTPPPAIVGDVEQDFKELNIFLDDIYKFYSNGGKDSGHLWIEFTDKFNAFKKRIIAIAQAQQPVKSVKQEEFNQDFVDAIKEVVKKEIKIEQPVNSVQIDLKQLQDVLHNVQQVMAGYSQDDTWSDYDRDALSELIKMQYQVQAALEQPVKSDGQDSRKIIFKETKVDDGTWIIEVNDAAFEVPR